MKNSPSHIILISCVKKKKTSKDKAKYLYISSLFQKYWQFAQILNPDKIFILSAKHGLLDPEQVIEPYDESLNTMNTANKKIWANNVLNQMRDFGLNIEQDEFTILAGKNYRQYLIGEHGIKNAKLPLSDVGGIGKILSYLNHQIHQKSGKSQ